MGAKKTLPLGQLVENKRLGRVQGQHSTARIAEQSVGSPCHEDKALSRSGGRGKAHIPAIQEGLESRCLVTVQTATE